MTRIFTVILSVFILSACSSNIEDAKKILEDSVVIETDIEFNEVYSYPGDVVCGLFSAYVSYHDPKKENAPFIVIDGELNKSPTDLDLKIYCSAEPAVSLMKETGVGPITIENVEYAKIIRDFSLISEALENYNKDTFKFPSEDQGLQVLQAKPKGAKFQGRYKQGGYLQEIPIDPWGRPYRYSHVQWGRVKGTFELSTLGASNEPGGSGREADVSSKYLPYLQHIAKVLNL